LSLLSGLVSSRVPSGCISDADRRRCTSGKLSNSYCEIATDRPDVTNSSLVVPTGSLQNENGVNFSMRDDGRTIDGTNSRWRLGVAPCFEVLVDLPTYFAGVQEPGNSGFSDVAPALK